MDTAKKRPNMKVVIVILSILLMVMFFLPVTSISFVPISWFILSIGSSVIPGTGAVFFIFILPLVMLIVELAVKAPIARSITNGILSLIYLFLVTGYGEALGSSSFTLAYYLSVLSAIAIVVLCIVDIVLNRKGAGAPRVSKVVTGRAPVVASGPQVACAKCGAMLPLNAKFCTSCGSVVEAKSSNACTQCGNELEPGAKFCGKCGTRIVVVGSVQEDAGL